MSDTGASANATVERTFVIADVRGYTRFTREQGDRAAGCLAQKFAALARDAVAGLSPASGRGLDNLLLMS